MYVFSIKISVFSIKIDLHVELSLVHASQLSLVHASQHTSESYADVCCDIC